MWILIKVVYPIRVEGRCTSFKAVDLVTFVKQKLCEICAVLTGDAGNKCPKIT